MATEDKTSIQLIEEERLRQIEAEGHTPQNDAMYNTVERLAGAAASYAMGTQVLVPTPSGVAYYAWPDGWRWNPQNPIRNLVKAGALIAAALDLARAGGERPTTEFDPLEHIKTKDDLKAYVDAVIDDQIEQGKLIRPQ